MSHEGCLVSLICLPRWRDLSMRWLQQRPRSRPIWKKAAEGGRPKCLRTSSWLWAGKGCERLTRARRSKISEVQNQINERRSIRPVRVRARQWLVNNMPIPRSPYISETANATRRLIGCSIDGRRKPTPCAHPIGICQTVVQSATVWCPL